MADILVKCAKCGKESRVSEFASSGSLQCGSCHATLELPNVDRGTKLQMKREKNKDELITLTAEAIKRREIPDVAKPASAEDVRSVLSNVHKARQKVKKAHAWMSWLSLIAVGAVMIGFQYYAKQNARWLTPYMNLRAIVAGVCMLGTFLVAFQDSTFQGLLCLLPPYTLYYVAVRMEYPLLQGATLAFFISLGAEMYYIPGNAVIAHAQANFNDFIVAVGNLIVRAGEPPDMPH